MRIMFVIVAMGRGGAEIQVKDLALELTSRGHHVAVVVLLPFEDFEAELRRSGVETLSLGMTKGKARPQPFVEFARFYRCFKPDVVHAHMFAAIMLARAVRCLPSGLRGRWKTLVCTSHSGREPSRARYLGYRLTSGLSEQWTSVSREGLAAYEANRAIHRARAIHLPNGVDVARFQLEPSSKGEARDALAVGNAFVWVAVGSFRDEDKDFGTLLEAFARVAARGSGSLLLIAGDGQLLDEKKKLAASLGISDRVRFLGLRTDVPRILRAADGYVLSSRYEAMPIVLLEAAASALPVVTTDVGESAEIIRNGEDGFVVPPGDGDRLADAMLRVEAMDEADRRRMGDASLRHVEERFSVHAVVDRWEALYARLSA
jgi:glycosyltransferase involved in cell wall biosynthesis